MTDVVFLLTARARLEEDLRLDFDSRVSVKDDTISDLHEEVRLAKEECCTLRRRAEDAAIKLRSSESQLAATTLAKSSLEVSFAETTSYLNDTRKALETLQMEMEDKIAAHRTRAREAAASEAAARAALEAETELASKETSEANKRCEEGEFLYFNACTCTGNWTDVVFFYHNSRTNRRARNETRERRDAPSRTRRRIHRRRHP